MGCRSDERRCSRNPYSAVLQGNSAPRDGNRAPEKLGTCLTPGLFRGFRHRFSGTNCRSRRGEAICGVRSLNGGGAKIRVMEPDQGVPPKPHATANGLLSKLKVRLRRVAPISLGFRGIGHPASSLDTRLKAVPSGIVCICCLLILSNGLNWLPL